MKTNYIFKLKNANEECLLKTSLTMDGWCAYLYTAHQGATSGYLSVFGVNALLRPSSGAYTSRAPAPGSLQYEHPPHPACSHHSSLHFTKLPTSRSVSPPVAELYQRPSINIDWSLRVPACFLKCLLIIIKTLQVAV